MVDTSYYDPYDFEIDGTLTHSGNAFALKHRSTWGPR